MEESPGDIYHVTRDAEYLRQAQAEAEYFDQPRFMGVDLEFQVTDPYWNEQFTGDKKVAWYETIPSYGTFRRGCALGAGGLKQRTRILQQNPALHLTIYDISEESLAILERGLGGRFPGRVATRQVDLNFAELPENGYDLIISASCLHHLLNLEHIAYEINRSLTSEGFFFFQDYVGEARFQFAEEKKRLFEAALEEARSHYPFLRSWQVVWPDLSDWEYSPFEAVRPGEILTILGRCLDEVSVRTFGAVIGLLLFLRPVPGSRQPVVTRSRWRAVLAAAASKLRLRPTDETADFNVVIAKLASHLMPLDRLLANADILQPGNAFAVYRKKRLGEPAAD